MKIDAEWINDVPAQRIMGLLNAQGNAYFVGGCVRNALLDVPVSDLDISTDLLPTEVLELAKAAKLKAIPTGIEHGTVTVIINKIPFEVTTFRKDIATDGRRAVVAFSNNIIDDALRRDFTMNAIYADAAGEITDPLGGMTDTMARRVRFIENADQRIAEDYLRILRYFRFHAWYGDADEGLDPDALAACVNGLEGLQTLSKERVTAEVLKLLSAPNPSQSIHAMHKTGVLSQILPGSDPTALGPLVHLEAGLPIDPMRRLAVLGGEAVESLRLSKKEAQHLADIHTVISAGYPPAQAAYRMSKRVALNAILVLHASLGTPLPTMLMHDLDRGANAVCPVGAVDFLSQFEGPALGKRLNQAKEVWLASDFQKTRDELLD